MQRVSAPRSIKGSCGVPADYGQSHNCALGYLLLADVMQAFNQVGLRSCSECGMRLASVALEREVSRSRFRGGGSIQAS